MADKLTFLEDAIQDRKTPAPSVLIYGHDATLLETRTWVFERNGFEVDAALHLEEAQRALDGKAINVFLMCHTIPQSERHSTVTAVQSIRPGIAVMLITTAGESEPAEGWDTVDALAGTAAMLAVARRAIEGGRSSEST